MSLKTSSALQMHSRSLVAHGFVSECTIAFNVLPDDQNGFVSECTMAFNVLLDHQFIVIKF